MTTLQRIVEARRALLEGGRIPVAIYLGHTELAEACRQLWDRSRMEPVPATAPYGSADEMFIALRDHHPVHSINCFGIPVLPVNTASHFAVV